MLIKNLLYILQLENYRIGRFLKFVYMHHRWWALQKRGVLSWTKKAILIYALSWILVILLVIVLIQKYSFWLIVFILPILPLIISLSLILILPLDYFLKNIIIKRASKIREQFKDLIVIGITGSYGKTSEKEILSAILSAKFKILATPENINTDLGIAEFIIKNASNLKNYDIFIVEMGAYQRGEIKKICEMVKPNYSILTGINEAHLERFGSLENTIRAKFELPEATAKISVLNFDDKNIKDNCQKFKIKKFIGVSINEAEDIKTLENFRGLEFKYDNIIFNTVLLAEHNITLILLAIAVAKDLKMDLNAIRRGVNKIKHITHRLEPIYNQQTNIWVIDDSYNANVAGIKSGLKVLERAKGRKVVLTPGLVELGAKNKEIHKKIGEWYVKKIDLVLLIKSKASDFIEDGLKENNFNNYKIYNSTEEAHNDLKNILEAGDTIIFQNDLPDNYF